MRVKRFLSLFVFAFTLPQAYTYAFGLAKMRSTYVRFLCLSLRRSLAAKCGGGLFLRLPKGRGKRVCRCVCISILLSTQIRFESSAAVSCARPTHGVILGRGTCVWWDFQRVNRFLWEISTALILVRRKACSCVRVPNAFWK